MMRPNIAAEKGIVKVVHPGRYVEILKEPVTAGEVMRKNPRHCLTRPDVFKFPWIVVKPESVLPPGKVFLLVPNRTLYDLMKSQNHRTEAVAAERKKSTPLPMPPSSPCKAFAGMTPKHQAHRPRSPRNSVKISDSFAEECYGDGTAVTTPYWMGQRNNIYEEFRRYLASEAERGGVDPVAVPVDGGKGEMALKSCLRKPESHRRSLGLRVSFVSEGKGDKDVRTWIVDF